MNKETTLRADTFSIVLTADERALVDGTLERSRKVRRFTSQDFKAMAGKRSYKSQRGVYRTFA